MKQQVDTFTYVEETNRLLRQGGLLLVAKSRNHPANAMTIGWGFLGTMWSRPVFVVAVRLSRHTHKIMEEADSFTVCLPGKDMDEWLQVCGTKSGRDMDKFKELGMTEAKSHKVSAPHIEECPVHVECKIIYKDQMKPGELSKDVEDTIYPKLNMHVLYYGEVQGVYADEDAGAKLK